MVLFFKYLICIAFLIIHCNFVIANENTQDPKFIKYSPEELKKDLYFLFQTLEYIHPNLYFKVSKDEIDSIRNIFIEKDFKQPLSAIDFWKIVTPAVTLLGDGHTVLRVPRDLREQYLNEGGKIIPFEVYISPDNLTVKENYTNDSLFSLNSRIVSINNVSSKDIVNNMLKYQSGERLSFRLKALEIQFKALFWLLYGHNDEYEVEFISNVDGKQYKNVYSGLSLAEFKQKDSNKLKPAYKPYEYTYDHDNNIGIIKLNTLQGSKNDFEKFFKKTFSDIKNQNPLDLIIDIRDNGGGNAGNGDILFNYITKKPYRQVEEVNYKISVELRTMIKKQIKSNLSFFYYIVYPLIYVHPDGRKMFLSDIGTIQKYNVKTRNPKINSLSYNGNVYLLTSSFTFSAASQIAAAFKCYNMGTIIGEETGGLTTTYTELISFQLPNTKLMAGSSCLKMVAACGKDDGHGVIPDYIVKPSIEDLNDNVDRVMEFTKGHIHKKRINNTAR